METLPEEEARRLSILFSKDESARDRKQFVYAFDILRKNWACEYSIWPMPNADVRKVINGQVNLDDVLFENLNEVEKGMFFEEQREFVAEHIQTSQMLCEATSHPCLQEKCQLYETSGTEIGGLYGICSQYKIAFKK